MAGPPNIKIPWLIIAAVVSIAGGFGITALLDSAGVFPAEKGFTYANPAVVRPVATPTPTVKPPTTRTATPEPAATPTNVAESQIPQVTPSVTATSPVPTVRNETEYVVKQGDTLLDIANKYDITVDAIVNLNGLSDKHTLALGQKLKIPQAATGDQNTKPGATPTSQSNQKYTVKPGDTLLEIAGRFNTTVDAIMASNNLASPNTLKDGQDLVIPTGR